jgi:hypothetical protein
MAIQAGLVFVVFVPMLVDGAKLFQLAKLGEPDRGVRNTKDAEITVKCLRPLRPK